MDRLFRVRACIFGREPYITALLFSPAAVARQLAALVPLLLEQLLSGTANRTTRIYEAFSHVHNCFFVLSCTATIAAITTSARTARTTMRRGNGPERFVRAISSSHRSTRSTCTMKQNTFFYYPYNEMCLFPRLFPASHCSTALPGVRVVRDPTMRWGSFQIIQDLSRVQNSSVVLTCRTRRVGCMAARTTSSRTARATRTPQIPAMQYTPPPQQPTQRKQ